MFWLRWHYFQSCYHICCILTRISSLVYVYDFCAGLGEHEDKVKYGLFYLQSWFMSILHVLVYENIVSKVLLEFMYILFMMYIMN